MGFTPSPLPTRSGSKAVTGPSPTTSPTGCASISLTCSPPRACGAQPMPWIRYLVAQARKGKFPLPTLAANIASFCGRHPAADGERLASIIGAALRGKGKA